MSIHLGTSGIGCMLGLRFFLILGVSHGVASLCTVLAGSRVPVPVPRLEGLLVTARTCECQCW